MPEQTTSSDRVEFHPQALVPGLRHIGYDVFADARPSGLEEHSHPGAFEVCWIRRGCLSWQVAGRDWSVGPGDLFLTLPDERHGGRNGVMDRCELFWTSFSLDEAAAAGWLGHAESALLRRSLATSRIRVCRGPAGIGERFAGMLSALAEPDPLTPAVVRSGLTLLLSEVRIAYARAATGGRQVSSRIARALAIMHEQLATGVAVDAIAGQVGLRPSQFRAVFRSETGFSPQEHLLRLRVERAKELLADRRRSVTAVALACGFASSQYFATAFRRSTGFTPRSWRQRAA